MADSSNKNRQGARRLESSTRGRQKCNVALSGSTKSHSSTASPDEKRGRQKCNVDLTGSTKSHSSTASPVENILYGEEHRVNNLAHGTLNTLVDAILDRGIRQMEDRPIDFVEYTQENVEKKTGMIRKDADTLIIIDGWKASEHGMKFFRSENGTILTSGLDGIIATEYISSILDLKTGKEISRSKLQRRRSPGRRWRRSHLSGESDQANSPSRTPRCAKVAEKTKVPRYAGSMESMPDSKVFRRAIESVLPRQESRLRRRSRTPRFAKAAETKNEPPSAVAQRSKKNLDELKKPKTKQQKLEERPFQIKRNKDEKRFMEKPSKLLRRTEQEKRNAEEQAKLAMRTEKEKRIAKKPSKLLRRTDEEKRNAEKQAILAMRTEKEKRNAEKHLKLTATTEEEKRNAAKQTKLLRRTEEEKERVAALKTKGPRPVPARGGVDFLKKRAPVAYTPAVLRQREIHCKQEARKAETSTTTTRNLSTAKTPNATVRMYQLPKRTSVLTR